MITFSSHLKCFLPYSGVVSIVVVLLYISTDCEKRSTAVILYVWVHLEVEQGQIFFGLKCTFYPKLFTYFSELFLVLLCTLIQRKDKKTKNFIKNVLTFRRLC